MHHRHFSVQLDEKLVLKHIHEAEQKSSGEIRICISRKITTDVMVDAQRKFEELGMTQTKHRNGVLIFIAPKSRTFAIVGDKGVHDICQNAFWEKTRDHMQAEFRAGNYTQGIVEGIDHAGELLAKHFPPEAGKGNELPDDIAKD
jgi:uncharacterized membrane protein